MPLKLVRKAGRTNWYIRGTVRGIPVREGTGTDNKGVAEEIRAKREWELLQGSVFGHKPQDATFADAVINYLEQDGEARFAKPLLEHFRTTALGRIDQAAVDEAAKVLFPKGKPASLVRSVYAPVSIIINRAAEKGMCAPLKLRRPKIPRTIIRWLVHAEASKLIEACSPHLKPLVAFLFYTGARIGEALWIEWKDIDLDRAEAQFINTKNGTDRGVPLHPDLVAILKALDRRNSTQVFRRPDGMPYEPLRDDEADTSAGTRIKTGFNAACRRANIRDFSPHKCRHTWATWHYIANRDIRLLMQLGGWKTERMVLRYTHVNVSHAAPSIGLMPSIAAPFAGPPVHAPSSEAKETNNARVAVLIAGVKHTGTLISTVEGSFIRLDSGDVIDATAEDVFYRPLKVETVITPPQDASAPKTPRGKHKNRKLKQDQSLVPA